MLFNNDEKVVVYISHKQHNLSLIQNHSANTIRLVHNTVKIKHMILTFIKDLL